jgi:hypothetical protein
VLRTPAFRYTGSVCYGINFSMSHFGRTKVKDLAQRLGIDRRSLARLLASKEIPGFERTPKGRWRLVDLSVFEVWAKEYRATAEARCGRASRIQRDRVSELRRCVRFTREWSPSDSAMIKGCENEIQRIETEEIRPSLSTTQKARELGITSQAVRDRAASGKIPRARLIGQRWRFECPG